MRVWMSCWTISGAHRLKRFWRRSHKRDCSTRRPASDSSKSARARAAAFRYLPPLCVARDLNCWAAASAAPPSTRSGGRLGSSSRPPPRSPSMLRSDRRLSGMWRHSGAVASRVRGWCSSPDPLYLSQCAAASGREASARSTIHIFSQAGSAMRRENTS